ncbi:MAG: Smr/MutS family protein [Phreatobacter sp.]|uniref:Smr/MutS family protein n=1 Tax=Phreatobacter sp. TaxID=1966341 RepID=UPI00273517F9|nr:Smr/MutS family protein [Phreatobacter sp.]MDP2803989.1 Smr/MutS family protein [Phreatobacter sp.]
MSRRPRHLSAEDRRLWTHVAASVKPLDAARALALPQEPEPAPAPPPEKPARSPAAQRSIVPVVPPPPPLAALEKGLKRKLTRGRRDADARIDLHGMTQDAAHRRLMAFLRQSQAAGHGLVIVITGKGAPKRLREIDEEAFRPDPYASRGVLRRVVPQWLALPEMRALVIGFEEAAAGHGGAGALYVRIRRP